LVYIITTPSLSFILVKDAVQLESAPVYAYMALVLLFPSITPWPFVTANWLPKPAEAPDGIAGFCAIADTAKNANDKMNNVFFIMGNLYVLSLDKFQVVKIYNSIPQLVNITSFAYIKVSLQYDKQSKNQRALPGS
jgi:hypothetical protein